MKAACPPAAQVEANVMIQYSSWPLVAGASLVPGTGHSFYKLGSSYGEHARRQTLYILQKLPLHAQVLQGAE